MSLVLFFLFFQYGWKFLHCTSCSWTVGDVKLDLTYLSTMTITATDNTYTYNYTACSNKTICSSGKSMAAQLTKTSMTDCQAYIATFDENITPTYDAADSSTWTFKYSNGQLCTSTSNPRKLTLYFTCDQDAIPYETVTVKETASCTYAMQIFTCLACGENACKLDIEDSSSSSSSGLSGGWVFIILLICALVLYCGIGYAYLARNNKNGYKDYKNNVPHLTFWKLVPKYTWAGCCVTKEYLTVLINKAKEKMDNNNNTSSSASSTSTSTSDKKREGVEEGK